MGRVLRVGALNPHRLAVGAIAAGVFVFTWLLRFNDPNGSFAGLTDDHFFYVVRGWQILFGDLPVRDFVDHGAPLHFYVAAAVQAAFGRGTLSELAFTTTMLAAGSALTFWLAARASGSIAAGVCGAAVHVSLFPRFYNYPKVIVYAAALPLLWWLADRPGRRPCFWLAVTTVVAFLFRHDHGVYVAAGVLLTLAVSGGLSWTARLRHALTYAALTILVLSPYLVFLQLNGGLVSYASQTTSWAARERDRTPVEWPGLFDYPNGVSEETQEVPRLLKPIWSVRDNSTAWWYYFELVLPVFGLIVALVSRDGFRPGWRRARVKVAIVALLGIILNVGFLRSPLEARLADPFVPHAVVLAWLVVALPAMFRAPGSWAPRLAPWRPALATALATVAIPMGFVLATTVTDDVYDRLANAGLTEGPRQALRQAASVARSVSSDWQLETWKPRAERSPSITLAMYVNDCTSSDSRIFVSPYIPQVLALGRRAFAGGHADLRPGYFTTDRDQRLVLERLQRQLVPVALLATDGSLENFRRSFPLLTAYLDEHFEVGGTHVFDSRFAITLLVDKNARSERRFADLDWPCFA
jgi:hypothetical protein